MDWWLIAAAVLMALTLGVHVLAGRREVVRPLLAATMLDEPVRMIAHYCGTSPRS